MKQQITNHVRAGYPGLYLVSHEEQRVEAELKTIAKELKYGLHFWSITEGLVAAANGQATDCHEAVDTLNAVHKLEDNTIVLLRDFHVFFDDANPVAVRLFREELRTAKTKGKTIVVLACRLKLPPELEREMVVLDFTLPTPDQIGVVLDGIAKSAKLSKPKDQERFILLDASKGMTTVEAENAFALAIVETGKLDAAVVAKQKGPSLFVVGEFMPLFDLYARNQSPHWRNGERQPQNSPFASPEGKRHGFLSEELQRLGRWRVAEHEHLWYFHGS